MSFDGLAGIHCLVLPVYTLNGSPKPLDYAGEDLKSSQSYWRDRAMLPITELNKRVVSNKTTLLELFGRRSSNTAEADSVFNTYFTTLRPFSVTPAGATSSSAAKQRSKDEEALARSSTRSIVKVLGLGNFTLGAQLRDEYASSTQNTTDPIVVYGQDDMFKNLWKDTIDGKSVASKIVSDQAFSRAMVSSFYIDHQSSTSPHLLQIPGFISTQKSFLIIPLGIQPSPRVMEQYGLRTMADARWFLFCKIMTRLNHPLLSLDAPAVEFVQQPPQDTTNTILGNENMAPRRTVLRTIAQNAEKRRPPKNLVYSAAAYYRTLDLVFADAVKMNSIIGTQNVRRLWAKAQRWIFCTRLPMTMWNHAVAFPFRRTISVATIDITRRLANRPADAKLEVLGAGSYGAVVKMSWVFDDDALATASDTYTPDDLAPNAENMALADELWNHAALLRSCTSSPLPRSISAATAQQQMSFDSIRLDRAVQKTTVKSLSIDFVPTTTAGGPKRSETPVSLPVLLFAPQELSQKGTSYVDRFYAACIEISESIVAIMRESERDKYSSSKTPPGLTSERLIKAYVKYVESGLSSISLVTAGGVKLPTNEVVMLIRRFSIGRWSICLHTRVAAALKQSSQRKNDYTTESAYMQFFSSYALSPSSVDGLYSVLTSRFPLIPVPVRRFDINQSPPLRSRYLSAVHPEDRTLNPRGFIQRSPDHPDRLQMVFVDDEGSVIAVHRNIEPPKEQAQVLSLPVMSSAEVRIPPAKTDGTCPAYGSATPPFDLQPGRDEQKPTNVMLVSLKSHGSVSDVVDAFARCVWTVVKSPDMALGEMLDNYAAVSSSKDVAYTTSLSEIVQAMADAAGTLAFINNHGVSHGDFKPGNMVMDAQNKAFVTDFGNATAYGNIALHATLGYLPWVYNYNQTSATFGYVRYIAKDSVMDKMSLGGTILNMLFGMPYSFDKKNDYRRKVLETYRPQPGAPKYGPLDNYEEVLEELRKQSKGDANALFLRAPVHVSFAGMASFDVGGGKTSTNVLCEKWQVSRVDRVIVERLVHKRRKAFCTAKDVPVNPILVRYVMQQMFEIGRLLYSEPIEVLDAMNAGDSGEASDGWTSDILLTDETTRGYSPEWYLLPAHKRKAYGFLNELKCAETRMMWLIGLMQKDQAASFAMLTQAV